MFRRNLLFPPVTPPCVIRSALAVLLMLLLVSVSGACAHDRKKPAPSAENGVLDLAGWHFGKDGSVALEGAWDFYWKRLVPPAGFAGAAFPPGSGFIAVPSTWDDFKVDGKKIGSKGFATYRLRIDGLPAEKALALEIPRISSAAKIWVNGNLLFRAGMVGNSEHTARPRWAADVVEFPAGQTTADVVVQVSNFHFRSGGIERNLILGERSELFGQRNQTLFFLLLISGGMLVMGLYHLVLFLVRKQEPASLYLGMIFLLQFVFQLCVERYFLFSALPNLSWAFLYKLMLVSYYGTMAFTVLFLRTLFPEECSKRLTLQHVGSSGLFILAAVAFPAPINSHLEPFYDGITVATLCYLIYVLARAAIRGRQGARVMVGGVIVLFAAILHDILRDYAMMAGPRNYVLFGEFGFLITQSFILAIRFSRAFSMVERQEAALERANVELESKVRERTAGLEKSVREKEVLLREVHHRVKNNMQVIVSLLNLQSDNLNDRAAIRALEDSRDRIRSMMLIHENLYMSDNLAMIDFGSYAERIVSEIFFSYGQERGKIDFTIDAAGVTLDLDHAVPCGLVLNELTTNALKHAFNCDRQGKITVDLVREDPGGYKLTIADNGIGLPDDIDLAHGATLGLRLVWGLVERQLKGEIEVSGKGGAQFSIRFGAPAEGV